MIYTCKVFCLSAPESEKVKHKENGGSSRTEIGSTSNKRLNIFHTLSNTKKNLLVREMRTA